MYPFTYHRPDSIDEAERLCLELDEAKFLAGGHTLLPTMKQRLAAPAHLIDLAGISKLREIRETAEGFELGAMVHHAEVARSDIVRRQTPALSELASVIGDPLVRHRGTIGGSIANNDPAADYPAACIALRAEIVTNKRRLSAADFFSGLFETVLERGEIVTAIRFRPLQRAAYAKFKSQASRYALAGVFIAQNSEEEVCVAVTGAGANGVFRWHQAEEALQKRFDQHALANPNLTEILNEDAQAGVAYRAHLVRTMAKQAVSAISSR